jgi:hypothetical protein
MDVDRHLVRKNQPGWHYSQFEDAEASAPASGREEAPAQANDSKKGDALSAH